MIICIRSFACPMLHACARVARLPVLPRSPVLVLVAALLAGGPRAGSPSAHTRPLAITHVTVIDATGAPPRPDCTVLVTGDRIAAVDTTAAVAVPRGAQVIEGTGKFLIPGLWDMHGHLSDATEAAFPLLVASGVTGVR